VILGAVLLVVYAVVSDAFSSDSSRRIEIGEAAVELLAANWERQWRRRPTEDELRSLVEARVREEVLYREALAVGLDRDDVVVRRRMVQKMELLSQDLALLADPTDQELQAFFQERPEEYRLPPRLSFSHVYFNLDQRGPAAEADSRRVLDQLRAEEPTPERAPERGDRFMLRHDYSLHSPLEVQQLFGGRFAEALFKLEPGWHGPVASGYGIHLVRVGQRADSRIPEFSEIRDRLVADYNRMRSDRAKTALFEGLSSGYHIEIDDEAVRQAAMESRGP
jgi:hypothetical protein